jgi:hypothetical protein
LAAVLCVLAIVRGTLMVVALEDLITPALLEEKGTSFLDTEFFSTQVIVIQK